MSLMIAANRFHSVGRLMGLCGVALFAVGLLGAQSKRAMPAGGLPLPDPGYELYYHDGEASANAATRWGYHDGWSDGRHDRNRGQTAKASTKDNYESAPGHGFHEGVTRDTYKRLYREAYVHGYERGSRS